jgi:hypothetical protein
LIISELPPATIAYRKRRCYAVEHAVQKHDFDQTTVPGIVGGKPLIAKGLQEHRSFRRQFGGFVGQGFLLNVFGR